MVSKSKFLAVVLSGLVLVGGGRAVAADQNVSARSQQGTQPTSNVKKQQKGQGQYTSTGKKSVGYQDQTPVCTKPQSKVAQKGQRQQSTSVPSKKGVSYQDQSQVTTPSKQGQKVASTQGQGQGRPRVYTTSNGQGQGQTRFVKNQKAQSLQQ